MTNYLISFFFAVVGIAILLFYRSLSNKLSDFYTQRFNATFGGLAQIFKWNDPNRPFMRFMYRGFVITAGIIVLVFAVAAFMGTNFVGPSTQTTSNSVLQVNQ
jgi:hypothetical protein